ncbi:MAG: hypothetical protein C0408_11490, partial [Odoribacter sp.]|nr:hypothetical protein [Odoribacter sp.]
GAFGCTVVAAISILFLPGLLQNLATHMKLRNFKYLNVFFKHGMALLLFRSVSVYGQTYLTAFVCQRVITDLRNELYSHLQKMSFSFHAKWRTGELISRTVNDIDVIQGVLLNYSLNIVLYILTALGLTLKMFDLSWRLALIIGIVAPIVGIAMALFGGRIKHITNLMQAKIADISSLIQETISGIRTVKSFSREDYEIGHFRKEGERNLSISMKRAMIEAIQEPIVEVIVFFGNPCCYMVCCPLFNDWHDGFRKSCGIYCSYFSSARAGCGVEPCIWALAAGSCSKQQSFRDN